MGSTSVSKHVVAVLARHRGTDISLAQIQSELKEEGIVLDLRQIQNCMQRLVSQHGMAITVVMRGNVWRYENTKDEVTPGRSARAAQAAAKKAEKAADELPKFEEVLVKELAPVTAAPAAVKAKTHELFEMVGRTSDGDKIVRDKELTLYRLQKL